MLQALFWGLVTSGSLLVGAMLALALRPSPRTIGLALAFGSGALISAVAYDLVLDAFETDHVVWPAIGLATGALAFFVGDALIDRMGGHGRKSALGEHQAAGSPLAIVLGAVLDGIPESVVLGATLVEGGAVSVAFVVAVLCSNLPEAISGSSGLATAGWARNRILGLWALVVAASTTAAVLGFAVFDTVEGLDASFILAFAAGAVLVMLADTMMPEAFALGGRAAGLMTTLGFAVAYLLSQAG
jgi:ZIP family zinc transporter